MTENNEKTLNRAEIEDNETEKVAGGVGVLTDSSGIAGNMFPDSNTEKTDLLDVDIFLIRCSKCNTEGHTAENCPNFNDV